MEASTLKDLLEAGVHFGHQTRRWNPKMKRFIFGERNGIYIIDLQKTLKQIEKARELVEDKIAGGGKILFVGTKRQIKEVVLEEALRCDMFYVTNRWLGGMLTNFQTIRKNIRRLRELEVKRDEGGFDVLPKKEVQKLKRELVKLEALLGGIKSMEMLPAVIFIVDSKKERIAVNEGNKLGIPIVAIVDTNSDPDPITIPIAGNDDAIRSVRVITSAVSEAVIEGKAILAARQQEAIMEKKEAEEIMEKIAEEAAEEAVAEGLEDDVDVEQARRRMIRVAKKVKQTRKTTTTTTTTKKAPESPGIAAVEEQAETEEGERKE
jgi:small subunit ribosomal protein S2